MTAISRSFAGRGQVVGPEDRERLGEVLGERRVCWRSSRQRREDGGVERAAPTGPCRRPARARCMATAVPMAPAPNTVTCATGVEYPDRAWTIEATRRSRWTTTKPPRWRACRRWSPTTTQAARGRSAPSGRTGPRSPAGPSGRGSWWTCRTWSWRRPCSAQPVPFPILVAPTAFHRLAHPEGEVATAKGVLATGTTMVVSTIASVRLEDVAETGVDRWFQLYVFRDRELTGTLVKRAYTAGYRAIVLTVDTPLLGTRYRDERNRFQLPDGVGLANLAVSDLPPEDEAGRPGSSLSHFFAGEHDASLSWADLPWLRSLAPLPLVLKGIVTAEDARLAVEAGVDGIVVSNHGGRQLDGAPATLDALPEVVEAVAGRAEVYLDGGVRRGSDVLTALALGARAVFVGRPVLWGLAVDGAAGVHGGAGDAPRRASARDAAHGHAHRSPRSLARSSGRR